MTDSKPSKPQTKPAQTRLPVELLDRIDQQATDRNQTRSDRLADLIERGLEVEILAQIANDHKDVMAILGIVHDKLLDIEAIAKGEK